MKTALLLILAFSLCECVNAQTPTSKVTLSLVGGLNAAFPVGPDATTEKQAIKNKSGYESGGLHPRIGINLGLTGYYSLSKEFSVGTGLIYSQKGYVDKIKYTDSFQTGSYVTTTYQYNNRKTVHLDYLDIPINAKYKTGALYFLGGLNLAILAGDKYTAINSYTSTVTASAGSFTPVTASDSTSKTGSTGAFGLLAGFDLGMGLESNKFGICVKMVKTGKPFNIGGIGFGYPNLTLMASVTYNLLPAKTKEK